ncbi:hypothetical protein DB346_12085 [Verrucomicrobia bacterium LW23]|nr:hypothetical protein DB346_12085 [Verrucomicrobia bacterium LW23]
MHTCKSWYKLHGLTPPRELRQEILAMLEDEARRSAIWEEPYDADLMRLLMLQLFSMGFAEDSLPIYQAKFTCFDTACGMDMEFMLGAGIVPTVEFLKKRALDNSDAAKALGYLQETLRSGHLRDFLPEDHLGYYRNYFG